MIVLVALSITFLACLLACVVPLVAFFTPDNTNVGAPTAKTIQTVDGLSFATRQKLYLLFMIPAALAVHAIVVYLIFYRHARNIYYRIEVAQISSVALALTTKEMTPSGVAPLQLSLDDSVQQDFGDSTAFRNNRSIVLIAPPTDDQKVRHHARRANVAASACPVPFCTDVAALLRNIDVLLDDGNALRDLIQTNLEKEVGKVKVRDQMQCNTAEEHGNHHRIVLTKKISSGALAPSPPHPGRRRATGYFSA